MLQTKELEDDLRVEYLTDGKVWILSDIQENDDYSFGEWRSIIRELKIATHTRVFDSLEDLIIYVRRLTDEKTNK